MIARIRGNLVGTGLDHALVDCAGVGYLLTVSAQTASKLPTVGQDVVLHAHMVVRDDSMSLYGFADEDERSLFQMLLGVSSVGPKLAIAVVGSAEPGHLRAAIAGGDAARLQAIPGVGKRTAERICLDLRDAVGGAAGLGGTGAEESPRALARDGLLALGVEERSVDGLLDRSEGDTVEELIQSALRASRA
ncbi:MAG: Holliday junction branch migration protein RuvA [Solirubrobacterales bacterium]|nr:Holliday junction branch migration protein RuvA [Solirubrobacterales bacterium]